MRGSVLGGTNNTGGEGVFSGIDAREAEEQRARVAAADAAHPPLQVCSLCSAPGHNRSTCPKRKAAPGGGGGGGGAKKARKCSWCREPGHCIMNCPVRKTALAAKAAAREPAPHLPP